MTYYTPPEIAKLLKTRYQKVLKWIQSGDLKASNTSESKQPRYRVKESDFDAFMEARSVTKAAVKVTEYF